MLNAFSSLKTGKGMKCNFWGFFVHITTTQSGVAKYDLVEVITVYPKFMPAKFQPNLFSHLENYLLHIQIVDTCTYISL